MIVGSLVLKSCSYSSKIGKSFRGLPAAAKILKSADLYGGGVVIAAGVRGSRLRAPNNNPFAHLRDLGVDGTVLAGRHSVAYQQSRRGRVES